MEHGQHGQQPFQIARHLLLDALDALTPAQGANCTQKPRAAGV